MVDFVSERGHNRLTRRGALKLGGGAIGLLAIEKTFEPLGGLIDWAARNGWLAEGHPAQRMAKVEHIINLIISDPKSEEKRDLLSSWIKFNGEELLITMMLPW